MTREKNVNFDNNFDNPSEMNYIPTSRSEPSWRDGLGNILFNIIIPVVILNQISKRGGPNGPTIAVIVALLFPLGYGLRDYFTSHKRNWISVLGILNILMTGGLALFHLGGIYFAIKEAAFPLIIGLAVLGTTFGRRSLIEILLYNPQFFRVDLVDERLKTQNCENEFRSHLRQATYFLAGSFFFSAAMNFGLARLIFQPIESTLSETERAVVLNQQISQMTWLSFLVIALPSMVFLAGIIWYLMSGIKKMTGLRFEELVRSQ